MASLRNLHTELADLANKDIGCPVKSEFQRNEYFFGIIKTHAVFNISISLYKICSSINRIYDHSKVAFLIRLIVSLID